MDFTRDPEEFSGYLNVIKRDWTRAVSEFTDLVDHWQKITVEYYQGLVEMGPIEENVIKGKVLGKPFLIELAPLAIDQAGCAEVILSTNYPDCENAELHRFYFYRDGRVVGTDGKVLIDVQADRYSYGIYTAILRAVLEAPAPVRS
ncbi:hypothetical protein [Pseudomonas azerbaijanoccidentalis]